MRIEYCGAFLTLLSQSPDPQIPRGGSAQGTGEGGDNQEKGIEGEASTQEQQSSMEQNAQWAANAGLAQGMSNGVFGFDGTNVGFPNMGMNGMGDFSQMMQMMPNGMPNNMMGSFPNAMGQYMHT